MSYESLAAAVALFLEQHQGVSRVHHPSLAAHLGHELASLQMSDFGGMMSFERNGGEADALAVASRIRLFRRPTSLRRTESLIEHRRSIEGPHNLTPAALLRLSIGSEDVEDQIEDLAQALRQDDPLACQPTMRCRARSFLEAASESAQ